MALMLMVLTPFLFSFHEILLIDQFDALFNALVFVQCIIFCVIGNKYKTLPAAIILSLCVIINSYISLFPPFDYYNYDDYAASFGVYTTAIIVIECALAVIVYRLRSSFVALTMILDALVNFGSFFFFSLASSNEQYSSWSLGYDNYAYWLFFVIIFWFNINALARDKDGGIRSILRHSLFTRHNSGTIANMRKL